jgi:trk system potassium uptake protein TrkH
MVILRFAVNELKKLTYPRGYFSLKIGNDPFGEYVVKNIVGFFVLFISFFALTTLILTFQGYDIVTSFSASIATLGNIGPGLARVGAVENYAFFDNFSKLILSFNMLLGRLEIYSVLILLYAVFNPKKLH